MGVFCAENCIFSTVFAASRSITCWLHTVEARSVDLSTPMENLELIICSESLKPSGSSRKESNFHPSGEKNKPKLNPPSFYSRYFSSVLIINRPATRQEEQKCVAILFVGPITSRPQNKAELSWKLTLPTGTDDLKESRAHVSHLGSAGGGASGPL